MVQSANSGQPTQTKFVDLFCGVGGFRLAAKWLDWDCVFSCDIDEEARKVYQANFGDEPAGDIRLVDAQNVPDHDILFAGFPCQPFSILGPMKGMSDVRGTLFFDIARILAAKRPRWFVLENVKQLASDSRGKTLETIIRTTENLGYIVDWCVLNALDYGLPQKRERIFIVGNNLGIPVRWPKEKQPMMPLAQLLEATVPQKYYASVKIQKKRKLKHQSEHFPSIWHENKAGHVSSYKYSCDLRAGASHNYLLVNGVRRLTPREMFRLQGFPDSFELATTDSQVKKQAGNAVPVPVAQAIICQIVLAESQEHFYGTPTEAEGPSQTALPLEPVSA